MKNAPDSPKSWLDILKLIISFILGRKKLKQKKEAEAFKKTSEKLEKKYNRVDAKKNKEREKDLDNRLDNMF